jgi:hypothetical protein
MRNHRSTANPVIRLHPLDFSEEKVDLIYIAASGIPNSASSQGGQEYEEEEKKKGS